jgi:hypothetical protein
MSEEGKIEVEDRTEEPEAPEKGVARWEYLTMKAVDPLTTDELDELGRNGWRLRTEVPLYKHNEVASWRYTFEREVLLYKDPPS